MINWSKMLMLASLKKTKNYMTIITISVFDIVTVGIAANNLP